MVEEPEGLEELFIVPHAVDQVVPGGRQRIRKPVGFSSPVEELPVWCSSRRVGLGQVQDVGLVVQDHVRTSGVVSIYLVNSVTRIKVDIGGGTGPQEGYSKRPAQSLLIIEDLKLVHVSVAKELTSQSVFIPGYNFVIIPAPALEAMPWRYVANYVHFVSSILSSLKLPHQPLELPCRVCGVDQEPKVLTGTKVHIERDEAEARAWGEGIEAPNSEGVKGVSWEPRLPGLSHGFIKPL